MIIYSAPKKSYLCYVVTLEMKKDYGGFFEKLQFSQMQ